MSFRAVVKYLDNQKTTEKTVGRFVTAAVAKSSLTMERVTKKAATMSFTQRTGHLRRSIRANYKGMPFGKAEVQINPVREGEDVNYALYLEYGTKHIAPRAFFRRGAAVTKKKMPAIFAAEAKKQRDRVIGKPK